jgi:DNA-binding transcriptional LysR family regulator
MPLTLTQLVNRLSFRQLQIFEAVYRLKGYGKAADSLGLSQPAVSSQIRRLEEALDEPLFEYIGRKLYCTQAGERVARCISVIFAQLSNLQSDLHTLKGQLSGQLRLSAVNTVQHVLPFLLKGFLEQHPAVNIKVSVVNRTIALERLSENTDDLVLMAMVPSERPLTSLPFLDNELIPVAPAGYEGLAETMVPAQQFLNQPFLIREAGSGSRLALEQYCQLNRLALNPTMELGSNDAIKHGVMEGLGVAVLPRLSILPELRLGLIRPVEVKGFPLRRSWCLVYPQGKHPTPVTQAFLDYVQNNLKAINDHFVSKRKAALQASVE